MATLVGSYKSIARALDTLDALGEETLGTLARALDTTLDRSLGTTRSCLECDIEDCASQNIYPRNGVFLKMTPSIESRLRIFTQ